MIDDLNIKMVEYATTFIGRFYRWGGDDPSGFDCSGFVLEALKSVGIIEDESQDLTAHGLLMLFDDKKVLRRTYSEFTDILPSYSAKPGNLIFGLDTNNRARHVEIVLNRFQTLGASGGGSKTTSLEKAIEHNAFIKIRPVRRFKSRHETIVVDPFN